MTGGDGPRDEQVDGIAAAPPGFDTEDPYADVDLSDLPDWWRDLVEEFKEYGLRPYCPPQFADGTLKHEVVSTLEAELEVAIRFIRPPNESEGWIILVDDEPITSVGHHRDVEGYSVYEMDGETFASVVRTHVRGCDNSR